MPDAAANDIPPPGFDGAALIALSARFRSPADTFGLDQRVRYAIDCSWPDRLGVPRCYYRPVQEPILSCFWTDLRDCTFDQAKAIEIVSLMTGKEVGLRRGTKAGQDAGTGGLFVFDSAPPDDWLDRLMATSTRIDGSISVVKPSCSVEALTDLYFRLIWMHPFDDGNGRFARALICGWLARQGLIEAPCLGLNAVFDLRRDRIGKAFRHAALTDDRRLLQRELIAAIQIASNIVQRIVGGSYHIDPAVLHLAKYDAS